MCMFCICTVLEINMFTDDTDRWLRLNGPVIFFLFLHQMLFKASSLNWYKEIWGSLTWYWRYACLKYSLLRLPKKAFFAPSHAYLSNKKYQNDVK